MGIQWGPNSEQWAILRNFVALVHLNKLTRLLHEYFLVHAGFLPLVV
jgi:hypothetical protein